jgi:flagellar hook assembly protein FlgD
VTLKIYNLLGEEVVTLVRDEQKAAGYHAAVWDGRNARGQIVASGVYLCQLHAGNFVQTRRMALVR